MAENFFIFLYFELEQPIFLIRFSKKWLGCLHILLDGRYLYLLFEEYLQEKNRSVYILKLCREIGQSFEESIRGYKPVKYLDIIIEFGFCMM